MGQLERTACRRSSRFDMVAEGDHQSYRILWWGRSCDGDNNHDTIGVNAGWHLEHVNPDNPMCDLCTMCNLGSGAPNLAHDVQSWDYTILKWCCNVVDNFILQQNLGSGVTPSVGVGCGGALLP